MGAETLSADGAAAKVANLRICLAGGDMLR